MICTETGWKALPAAWKAAADGAVAVVLTTRRIRRLHGEAVAKVLRRVVSTIRWYLLPEGEESKSLAQVERCYAQLTQWGVDRHTVLVTLGGGVVNDLGGFVAATYLRGIPWVAVPTTLVAQLDSAIGGKVGVNMPEGKNLVGTFYQPRLTYCNVTSLETLPQARLREGLIEALKCGLLVDRSLVSLVTQDDVADHLPAIIRKTIRAKLRFVEGDVTDQRGRRAMLNLGHTVGHALEQLGRYRTWTHGAAVGAGLVTAARLSRQWDLCNERTVDCVRQAVAQLRQPTELPQLSRSAWGSLLAGEKKRVAETIHYIALRRPTDPCIYPISRSQLAHALSRLTK